MNSGSARSLDHDHRLALDFGAEAGAGGDRERVPIGGELLELVELGLLGVGPGGGRRRAVLEREILVQVSAEEDGQAGEGFGRDALLVNGSEDGPRGKLCLPWTYGVVLPFITRKQFTDAQLGEVIPEHRVICSDEMQEATLRTFRRLWGRVATADEVVAEMRRDSARRTAAG